MTDKSTPAIPYASFVSVSNFLGRLAEMETGLPDYIDRSMLSTMSGATMTAVLGALEYLELIAAKDGKTQERLVTLIEARRTGGNEWQRELRSVLDAGYEPVVGELESVPQMTPAKLEECFKDAGVKQGQMMEKSLRFFIKGIQEAGIQLPKHLQTTRSRKAKKPKTNNKPKEDGSSDAPKKPESPPKDKPPSDSRKPPPAAPVANQIPDGFAKQEIPTIPGAYICYPVDMSENDFMLFEAALMFVKAVIQKKGGGS